MQPIKPIPIISDNPELNSRYFGFDAYARTISGMIMNSANQTPMVIGIYGAWGSGKTTLMQSVKAILDLQPEVDSGMSRRCKTVWFQAWKYAREDEILAALIEEIFKTMQNDGFLNECKTHIEKLAGGINFQELASKISKLLGAGEITQVFQELEYKKKLGFYDTFQEFFDRLIWDYLNWRPQTNRFEQTDDHKASLVVFIDDLDRCPKDRILSTLETIKLFMDKEACVFVIGAAHDIILKALKKTYEDDAVRFMDKIVQVSFNLPQIPAHDFETYLSETIPEPMKSNLKPHLPVIVPAVQNNPRQLKRFMNNLNLTDGIRRNQKDALDIEFEHLLYWSMIEYVSPQLRKEICENPKIVETLKNQIAHLMNKTDSKDVRDIREDHFDEQTPQSLQQYLIQPGLRNMIRQFDASTEQILQLITLTDIAKSAEELAQPKIETLPADTEGMVRVPAGEFRFGERMMREKIEKSYMIDIYPVTNEQFREFMEADGYDDESFWTPEGWQWRTKNNIAFPKLWNDERWNQPGHPVVGVSFYEASAYAKWARKALPTEIQWERAARGIDGKKYPWGDTFDSAKCNTKEAGIGKTTRVTLYPNGISSTGCYDMAGNVWEWTSTEIDGMKIWKGGSYSHPAERVTCFSRDTTTSPVMRKVTLGFRCVSLA